jgi:hypothetical protein
MRSQSCWRLWKASSLANFSIGILLALILIAPAKGSSRQQFRPPRSEIGLEIRLAGESSPPIRLAGPGNAPMAQIFRRSLKITDPMAAGSFTLLLVQAEVEGDGIRVSLSIIYNDLSDHEWWKHKKETTAGSYLIRAGESIRPAELDQFGIEPFEMKAVDATPVVLKTGEGPRITNSAALEVEKVERNFDFYRVWLKNKSGKNIVAYSISTGKGIMQVGSEGYGRSVSVLEAGATSRELYLHDPEIEVKGLAVLLVVFEDGSFEGDPKLATQYRAKAEGVRIQSPSVLRMIEQILKVDDSDLRAALDKLEAELWIIPEAMYKQPALQFLKTKFPDQDEKALSSLYEVFKGGLYDSRNIALQSLGDTLRIVKDFEERSQFASAVELIRRTLERLKETFGEITSAKR